MASDEAFAEVVAILTRCRDTASYRASCALAESILTGVGYANDIVCATGVPYCMLAVHDATARQELARIIGREIHMFALVHTLTPHQTHAHPTHAHPTRASDALIAATFGHYTLSPDEIHAILSLYGAAPRPVVPEVTPYRTPDAWSETITHINRCRLHYENGALDELMQAREQVLKSVSRWM